MNDSQLMRIAEIVSKSSNDPDTKVGAVLYQDNKIISVGYNSFPKGVAETPERWGKDKSDLSKNKHNYVVHAEASAILDKNCCKIERAILFTTLFPCTECMKIILKSGGIQKIVYKEKKKSTKQMEKDKFVEEIFKEAKIDVEQF